MRVLAHPCSLPFTESPPTIPQLRGEARNTDVAA